MHINVTKVPFLKYCLQDVSGHIILKQYGGPFFSADYNGHPSPSDTPPGAGEGAGAVQRLLQPVHHVPQGQDAERESPQE